MYFEKKNKRQIEKKHTEEEGENEDKKVGVREYSDKKEQNLRTPIPWTYRCIPHFSLVVLENNSSNSALSSGTVVSIGTSAFDRNCADGSTPLTSFKTF